MQVVAFYSENTIYEEEAEIWKESFKSCDTILIPIKNMGGWLNNCRQKPYIISEALSLSKDSILYVDIDARLMRDLEEIPEPELPGFCFLNGIKVKQYNRQLASGTIYFPKKEISFQILSDWKRMQELWPGINDQRTLQEVIESNKYDYQILEKEWLGIDKFQELPNPIIHHTQVSRTLKTRTLEGVPK